MENVDGEREGTKKRPSPDTQPRFASPSAEHNRKRAKVEDTRRYSKGKEIEYEVGLRDDDDDDAKHSRRFVRASSVVSPSKAPSIFPLRCKSVPLDGEDVVPSVDLAAIPPSPRRSPNRRDIEVKRAPSLPPMVSDSMEVDDGELRSDGLAHSCVAVPDRSAFNYTVNFATAYRQQTHRLSSDDAPISTYTSSTDTIHGTVARDLKYTPTGISSSENELEPP
ncbi:hypothetical protein EDC04DRAFT_1370062 [Pisolithus marmoratus]|nr:hypothetical protein EDC04DRAFT_1370062 [Pisolithus marmoratus]